MPVNDDAGGLFFLRRERPVVIGVQQIQNSLQRSFPAVVLKGIHLYTERIRVAQARRELHLAMDQIIVIDEPAEESDNDCWRWRSCPCSDQRLREAGLAERKDGPYSQGIAANERGKSTKCARTHHQLAGTSLGRFVIRRLYHGAAEVVKPGDALDGLETWILESVTKAVPHAGGSQCA